jgi:hypothetical protein
MSHTKENLGDVIYQALRGAYGLPDVYGPQQVEDAVMQQEDAVHDDKVIVVMVKDIYGRETIYPICPRAKVFASLAGTTTLTTRAVALIRTLGYQVNVQPREVGV